MSPEEREELRRRTAAELRRLGYDPAKPEDMTRLSKDALAEDAAAKREFDREPRGRTRTRTYHLNDEAEAEQLRKDIAEGRA